jgi:hypothetical protein
MRRIGVLMPFAVASTQYQARISAFLHGLRELGWIDGRNIQIEYRASTGSADEMRRYAAELVALAPDTILATGVSTVGPLQQVTSAVPIVFAAIQSVLALLPLRKEASVIPSDCVRMPSRASDDLALPSCSSHPASCGLPAEGEPDDECHSNDGQNDGFERTSPPCRTPTYARVGAPAARR